MIKFGSWQPDFPDLENPGLTVARNVLPASGGYRPFLGQTTISTNSLPLRPRGAVAEELEDGTTRIFSGTQYKLYRLIANVWTDVSRTPNYSTADLDYWEFLRWGGAIIATNGFDAVQNFPSGGTAFADLSATAPQAKHIAAIKNFVVLGNTTDATDGAVGNRVWWSGLANSTSWPTPGTDAAYAVQSGRNDIFDTNGGAINRIVGGEHGYVFQRNAITRMVYIGGSAVFQFDPVDTARGLIAPQAIAKAGPLIFYLAEDGFYAFDGATSTPIGHNKVDKYFFDTLQAGYLNRVQATVLPKEKVVVWNFPDSTSTDGAPNRQLFFSWADGRWTEGNVTDPFMFYARTYGYTLEDLDSVSSSIDTLTPTLDSATWMGGTGRHGGFNSSFTYVQYTGTARDAVIETAEQTIDGGDRVFINGVRPYIDGTTTVQIGTRNLQTDTEVFSNTTATNSKTGIADLRANARFMRVRCNTSGAYTHANGIDLIGAKKAGKR